MKSRPRHLGGEFQNRGSARAADPPELPILPHIVQFSVSARGGQAAITGGMGCYQQESPGPTAALLQRYAQVFGGPSKWVELETRGSPCGEMARSGRTDRRAAKEPGAKRPLKQKAV